MMVDEIPGPRWSREDYETAIGLLIDGMSQLQPDGNCCAICGDSDHQAWECRDNPLVKMARADKADSEWRCFTCGELFQDEAAAYRHFGQNASEPPSCRQDELGILLRWAECAKAMSVAQRPDSNIFKTVLAQTWDCVIRKISELRTEAGIRCGDSCRRGAREETAAVVQG